MGSRCFINIIEIKWKHFKSIFMYNIFLRKTIMKSGLMSMDVISMME